MAVEETPRYPYISPQVELLHISIICDIFLIYSMVELIEQIIALPQIGI